MPALHRRGVLPRRRRREDEGEDESSTAGDPEEFSVSEGSAISNADDDADVEGSEVSGDDEETRNTIAAVRGSKPAVGHRATLASITKSDAGADNTPPRTVQAAANVLQQGQAAFVEAVQGDQTGTSPNGVTDRVVSSAPRPSHPQETLAERSRKDHLEYVRQRNSNPAFVPNRGGFFLHDDRSATQAAPYGRPSARGRGRGYNAGYGIGRGYGQPITGPTEQQWAHDLHDTVNKVPGPLPSKDVPATFQIPTAKPAVVAPNRTFSVSTVLGNVTVQIFMPGMDHKKTFQNVVKKQHTLLPQHRPPLRRDKPVRISIPNEEPRYIFPSTERSFIFIPRAMRPNQQVYARGRGRGSFHGSRRPSLMGSTYTPSIAMSRRSSLGGFGSTGAHTPTDGTIPRGPMMQNFNRPIVRMPIVPLPGSSMIPSPMPLVSAVGASQSVEYTYPGPAILQSPTVALPMYQPRPQKAVSVAEIEPPAVKAPQQQQEQPFHQQMPPGVNLADGPVMQQGQSQPNLPMNTRLSHIPEGAVYAQPFQPYPMYQPGGYYGPAFPGGPLMYHTPTDPYSMNIGGPVLPPQFTLGQNYMHISQSNEAGVQPGAMAHETNGMVYYYDPTQFSADGGHMAQYPMTVGGGVMGAPAPGPYFYPTVPGGMFYPATQQ